MIFLGSNETASINRWKYFIRIILFLSFTFFHSLIRTQSSSTPATQGQSRTLIATAVSVNSAPELDGEVQNDEVWVDIEPITDFWQTTPYEGKAASERTEVRIVYTTNTLYFGVICFDRQPDQIIISDSRRDASLETTDSFRFILDTYRDGQNGFVFGTNPVGIEYDAQITEEGQGSTGFGRGGRQRRGSGGGINLNWDASWEVRTKVSEFGWSAEFAIPFRSIRYSNSSEQIWGINFQRIIARRQEKAYWVRLPRQYNLYRVSMAGTLTGLNLENPHHLQMIPYALAQGSRDFSQVDNTLQLLNDIGFDLKYGVTTSLTLDATYNTDFAQVEVDEQQVNLNRFSLFFPEKRPFFLENAGLFSVGVPNQIDLFFSRRIGIGPDEESIPILGGARLSGEIGGMKLGILNMQTKSEKDITPANNFAAARLKRELPNRTFLGMLFTDRVKSKIVCKKSHATTSSLLIFTI